MRISDWSSDVCSSDLRRSWRAPCAARRAGPGRRAPQSSFFSSMRACRAEWSRRVGGIGQLGVYAFHDPFEGVLLIDVNGLSVSLRPMPDGIDYRETEEHRIGAQRGGIDDAQNIAVRLFPHAQKLFAARQRRNAAHVDRAFEIGRAHV